MKYRYSFLVFLAAFLVQGTLLNLFSVFGVTPNLMLCLVVMFSLLYDNQMHGVVFECIFGVIADMCFMMYAGVSSLGYLAVSLIVMFAGKIAPVIQPDAKRQRQRSERPIAATIMVLA